MDPAKKLKGGDKITIGYWKIRGLVAPIYYILEYIGVPYEKVEYEQADDLNRDAWLSAKFNLGLDFPNIPYLIQGDLKMTESLAIMRYICNSNAPELLGKNPKDGAIADMVYGVVHDIKSPVTGICYGTGDRVAANKIILDRMERVSAFLKDKKFVVGDYVTYVDFYLFEQEELCDWLAEGKLFKQFPNLKEHHDRVASLPKFAEYYNSPKFMARPFNNKSAKLNN